MGLSSTTNRVSYAGDGSSTIFSFPYYFFAPADLQVFLYDVSSSVVQAQTLNTHYTISGSVNNQGVYPGGGNVVMNSSFPASLQIVITRSPSQVQNYTLLQNGQINSLALVQQFDYLTALVQRLQDEATRSVHLPDGIGTVNGLNFDPTLPQATPQVTSGGAPLILNSGATGFTYGVVATGASGSVSYFGILPVSNGGTGKATFATNAILLGNNSSAITTLLSGTAGTFLQSAGSGNIPTWGTPVISGSSVSGVLAPQFGGTGGSGLAFHGVLVGQGSSAIASLVSGSSGQFLQSQGPSTDPLWIPVIPAAAGGTGSGSSLVNGFLISSQGGTMGESPVAINASSAVSHGQGSLQNPGVNFLNATHSGLFQVNSSGQAYMSVTCSSVDVISMSAISGSLVNLGIGMPPGTSAATPLFINRTANASVNYFFNNLSSNVSSGTQIVLANNTGATYTTLENWNSIQGTSYVAGASALFGNNGQTGLIIGSEAATGKIGFTVGGRLIQHERMRLNSSNLTLNQGVRLIMSGSTGTVSLQAASSITTYTMVLPTAQASGFIQNDGNGNLSFAAAAGSALSLSTKSANYNALTSDDILLAGSGTALINTYGPTGNAGKVLRVKNSSLGVVTIAGSAATIDGTSIVLSQQYAGAELMCDGANFFVNKFIPRGSTRTILSSSGTYTTPFGCTSLWIRAIGGGGGGVGGGTTNPGGTNGGATIFGSSIITITAGGGFAGGGSAGGVGGTAAVLGTGFAINGSQGASGAGNNTSTAFPVAGAGAAGPIGGAGTGGLNTGGTAAAANSGSGGGGGAAANVSAGISGGGGGAGGYVDILVPSPLAATYTYVVGDKGAGGSAGTSGFLGGNGGTGTIIVEERYS